MLTANVSIVLRFLRLKTILHNSSTKLYTNGKKKREKNYFRVPVRSEAWVLITSQFSHSRPSTVVKLA